MDIDDYLKIWKFDTSEYIFRKKITENYNNTHIELMEISEKRKYLLLATSKELKLYSLSSIKE